MPRFGKSTRFAWNKAISSSPTKIPRELSSVAKRHGGSLRVVDQRSAYWKVNETEQDPDAILKVVESVLRVS